jgi:YHYH protein
VHIKWIGLTGLITLTLVACGGGGAGAATNSNSNPNSAGITENSASIDITAAIFVKRDADCAAYANAYKASAQDQQRSLFFNAVIEVIESVDSCTLVSNGIPNHDFNDATAHFATPVSAIDRSFDIPRNPDGFSGTTALSQHSWDAVMLNGVVLDLLSAGCYAPGSPMADADGNVAIGCTLKDGWLLDPLAEEGGFGTDVHHAHTQPDGTYHYHGNPNAMFDDAPGLSGSPVIGFAADGFPIYGSYFLDVNMTVRKAISGYTLKVGSRPGPDANNPGGIFDGTYIDDYEFTAVGDLDECNGMTVDGQYGYYVTDAYSWVLNCFRGTIDPSFNK